MRRRILALLGAAAIVAAGAAPAFADEAHETCRRWGVEGTICVWVLEPNPGGGNLVYVRFCEGATCIVVQPPKAG